MWEDLEPLDEATPGSPGVLVAVVPSLADWERIQREGWYRIPVQRAPRQIGAEFLAFYHPACFGELRWSIRSYAAIRRYSLATRRELLPAEPDHPRAGALYYRLELGPLQPLPHPVHSQRLRRVTFIHTDLRTLFQATEICDLWPREDPRARLWRGLQISGPVASYRMCAA
ncbi:MAG: hypothetical protein R6X16_02435 [Anaerolineae bacterium]